MANDILIVPGSSKIEFSGSQANTIQLETQTSGSLVFTGASGSLFGISDNFSGSLMSVSDVSGIPVLEVFDDDRVVMGKYSSPGITVTGSIVGIGTSAPAADLDVHTSNTDHHQVFNVSDVSGDSLFNIRQSANDALLRAYADGGVQRVQIHTDGSSYFNGGNIGINQTAPAGILHVEAGSAASSRNAIFYGSGGGNYITMGYNSSLGQHKISWDSSKLYISADDGNGQGSSMLSLLVDGTQIFNLDTGGAVLRQNGDYLYGVTSGQATVALIGVRTDNWMILGHAGYGFVFQNGAGSIDGGGNAYWLKPHSFTGGNGTLNGTGYNLGGSLDLTIGSQASGKGSRILLNSGHQHGEFVIQARQSTTYSTGNIGIYRRSGVTAFTTIMHIGGNGKVGIGTESPGPMFEVRGAANTSGTNLKHQITATDDVTAWSGYPAAGIAFAGNYNSTPSQIEFGGIIGKKQNAIHGDLRGQMQFLTNTNTNVQTIAMTINSSQNVGIGSTNPSAKLDVAGAVKTSDKFQIGNMSVMELDSGNLSIQHDEESVNTVIRGFDGDGSLTVGEGVTEINGNLKLTKSSNSWINLRAQDGGDTSGAGITWFETGAYSITAPQYGAKIVYNEDSDDFKMGTMSNNTYMSQIVLPRGSKIVETVHVRPQTNNFYDIGGSGIRYDDIFATNGTINTSDRNEKTQISGSNLGLKFVNDLNPVKYQFKSGSRTHYGLIAQEVSESLVSSSIHTDDFAGYIRSEMYTSGSVTLDKKGILASNEMDLANFTKSGEENLGLRYTEFVAPLIKAVQELTDEVKFLRASITGSTDLDQLKATISGSNFG